LKKPSAPPPEPKHAIVSSERPPGKAASPFALEIPHAMAGRNADVPDNRRIEFRIGINVGDVIIDKDDIYGDGVNIAARAETLASPGAICLSENAYQQIRGKLALEATWASTSLRTSRSW